MQVVHISNEHINVKKITTSCLITCLEMISSNIGRISNSNTANLDNSLSLGQGRRGVTRLSKMRGLRNFRGGSIWQLSICLSASFVGWLKRGLCFGLGNQDPPGPLQVTPLRGKGISLSSFGCDHLLGTHNTPICSK